MEALSPALYAILASEGRSDLTNPQKSIAASVLLAAEVWDLLNAGILWGVSSRRFHAGRQPLPADLDHLTQTHRAILVDGASCPSEVYRMLSAPGPCLEREDDYRRMKGPCRTFCRMATWPPPSGKRCGRSPWVRRLRRRTMPSWSPYSGPLGCVAFTSDQQWTRLPYPSV